MTTEPQAASSREELLEAALLLYLTAHEFVLSSEGFESEEERRPISRRYNIARAALEADRGVVVSFVLPSNSERWNWPVEGEDSIDALVEILDRANIAHSVRAR